MIEQTDSHAVIRHPELYWEAEHDAENFGGPNSIRLEGTELLRGSPFYVDDLSGEMAVMTKLRVSRKGGTAVVRSEGYFPYGAETRFSQTCRYASNHVRVTLDVQWPRGEKIKRHMGVGSVFLPGQWTGFRSVPPALHISEGAQTKHHSLPTNEIESRMVGHWHRPPLATVFEHTNGMILEIGLGDDIWRWEESLGYAPESGSYKILSEPDGIRFIREPLMCCEQFIPAPRNYRFTYYLAWENQDSKNRTPTPPREKENTQSLLFDGIKGIQSTSLKTNPENACLILDFRKLTENTPEEWRKAPSPADFIRNKRDRKLCWKHSRLQRTARRSIRQLAALSDRGQLVIKGLHPGPCWDPVHVSRGANCPENGLAHWDTGAILDFAVWAKQQLGPGWTLMTDEHQMTEFPAMHSIFAPNGFGELF